MLMNLFNRGLSTHVDPTLIDPSEAVEYTNVEASSGPLAPAKGPLDLSISINKYFAYYMAHSMWVSSATKRSYIEYKNVLYFDEAGSYPKWHNGTTEYRLGIVKPSATPSTASNGAGNLTGTYQYCFTYYSSSNGWESMPSAYSTELELTAEQVSITGMTASSDPQVDTIRIYRIGGDLTAMTLVDTVSNGTTSYVDNLGDLDVNGWLLDSTLNQEAPNNLANIGEAYGIFFGTVGDKLYFTEIGKPYAWNPFYYIDFDADITGLGFVQGGIFVFTLYKTYLIVGTDSNTFVKYLVSGDQGCVDGSTIQYIKNNLVWFSQDGICASSGGDIQVVSRQALGNVTGTIVNAVVHNEVYYVLFTDRILAFDVRFGDGVFKEFDFNAQYLGVFNDTLYVYYDGGLYQGFAGENLTLSYKGPKLTEGSLSTRKFYTKIYVYVTGTLTITIFIDDVNVYSEALVEGLNEIQTARLSQSGYTLQFAFSGTGTVYEITTELEGRKNV